MAVQSPASEFIWNVDMEVNLFHAMRGHKPAGVNRHFQMIAIHDKLSSACKKISSDDVWRHLSTLYDLQALSDSEIVPFPNKSADFCLPDKSTLGGLKEQTFPRSSFSSAPASDQPKPEVSSKTSTPKPSSSTKSSESSSKTPSSSSSTPASAHKSEGKSSSAKSNNTKTGSSGSTSSTPKPASLAQSPALFTPDPSPKRAKRTRGPSTNASPATPTEPASKRRR